MLKKCSEDPKIILCLWTISDNEQELKEKCDYCKSLGIQIDYVNDSPFLTELGGNKKFFNVLLDDRAGLESAYNNLKYVLDNK